MSKLIRSTVGLREALFEEWEAIRAGTSNPSRARSVAMMANTILQSVQVEIEYHRYVSDIGQSKTDKKEIAFAETKIELGSEEKKAA